MITLNHIEVNQNTPKHRLEYQVKVNPHHIRCFYQDYSSRDGVHTVIDMGGQQLFVKESPKEVENRINAAKWGPITSPPTGRVKAHG